MIETGRNACHSRGSKWEWCHRWVKQQYLCWHIIIIAWWGKWTFSMSLSCHRRSKSCPHVVQSCAISQLSAVAQLTHAFNLQMDRAAADDNIKCIRHDLAIDMPSLCQGKERLQIFDYSFSFPSFSLFPDDMGNHLLSGLPFPGWQKSDRKQVNPRKHLPDR